MTRGIVDQVITRTVSTKFGPKPVYDIVVAGTKYSYGFKSPAKEGITDGADIEFEFETDKYGPKIEDGTVTVHSSGTGAAPTPAAKPPYNPVGKPFSGGRADRVFPVPATSGEIAIIRQNALTNARELVAAYPSLFKADKGENDMIDAVLRVAAEFADYTSGRSVEKKLEKLKKKMEE